MTKLKIQTFDLYNGENCSLVSRFILRRTNEKFKISTLVYGATISIYRHRNEDEVNHLYNFEDEDLVDNRIYWKDGYWFVEGSKLHYLSMGSILTGDFIQFREILYDYVVGCGTLLEAFELTIRTIEL